MAYRRASNCCKTHYTEEPSEHDGVPFIPVCANCRQPCKIITVGEDDGTPRSPAQAEADARKNPEPETALKVGDGIKFLQNERNQAPTEAPTNQALEVKDGLIYQDGKVIGKALSDEDWYMEEFGETWKGSEKAIKALRDR